MGLNQHLVFSLRRRIIEFDDGGIITYFLATIRVFKCDSHTVVSQDSSTFASRVLFVEHLIKGGWPSRAVESDGSSHWSARTVVSINGSSLSL